MKKLNFLILIFVFINLNSFSQLKVFSSGNTVVGPNTIWDLQSLNLNSSGSNGSGALMSFGDNTTITDNILIGEYGTGDSDQLLLHGKKGLYFSTTGSVSSKMFLSEAGKFGIGTINPLSNFSLNSDGDSDYSCFIYNTGTERMANFQLDAAAGNYGIALVASVKNSSSTGSKHVAGNFSCYEASDNSKLTFGVRATAGRGLDGKNYAIYGSLIGTRDGAAVVGVLGGFEPDIDDIYAGYFYGNVKIAGGGILNVNGTNYTSDIRLKRNIVSLTSDGGKTNNLDKISSLEGIKYQLISPETLISQELSDTGKVVQREPINYNREFFGLSAQDLQIIYPELVSEDSNSLLSINYIGLIPVLIEAIKEQQIVVEELQSEIETLKDLTDNSTYLKGLIASGSEDSPNIDNCMLYQNSPNPFTRSTTIKMLISETALNADLYIYNMNGVQIKRASISERGEVNYTIHSNELNAGMYLYTLMVNGNIIDTKQMVLTD